MALMRTLVAAGLKRGKGSFAGIFLLMALTSAALTFTVSMYADLNAREAAALAEIGAGDVYAVDVAANLTDEVAAQVEALPEVGEARLNGALAVPVRFYGADGEAVDKNPTSGTALVAWGDALDFRLFSDDGMGLADETPEPGPDEAYVPASLKVSPGMQVGDELEVLVGDEARRFTIAGFFEDAQGGEPDAPFPAQSKLTAYRMAELNAHLSDEAREAGLTGADLTRIIAEKVSWANTATGMFASDTLFGYAMMVVVIGSAVLGVFALLLFAIALVICTHAIAMSIEENYADYGTLKALGLSNRSLRGMLGVEYAGVSLLGLAAGLALGSALVPFALPFFAQFTGVLATNDAPPAAAMLLLAALLALVAAIVAFKTRKLARISPLVAFRGGAADVSFRSRAARPLGGSHLSWGLAVRAIASAKRRYVGLAGCALVMCAFIVLVFGIGSALGGPNAAKEAFGMWTSDVSATLVSPDASFEEVERVIEEVSPIEKSWNESYAMVSFGGESHSFAGLSDLSLVTGVTEGRAPVRDNEALIGVNLAKTMDLDIGDELVVDGADGEERRFVVCGLLSAMFNAGNGTILTYDGVRDLAGNEADASDRERQYVLADPEKADEARAALEERFGDAVDARPSGMFSDTEGMIGLIQQLFSLMGYAMAAVAAALVFLAVSLIIGRMFTAERHDLGVYRALGFTSQALRLQFALRFFLVALGGCAAGATVTALAAAGSWGSCSACSACRSSPSTRIRSWWAASRWAWPRCSWSPPT